MKDNSKLTPRITKKQLNVLTLIYEFRFVNNKHINARLKQKDDSQTRHTVSLLLAKGYIGRNLSDEDRINRTGASYYLLPSGIRSLQTKITKLNTKSLKNIYRDRYASQTFILRCITLGDINLELKRLYPENITFFTKSNVKRYDFFPSPLPDGYIPFHLEGKQYKYYFIDLYVDSPLHSIARRRVRQYIHYAESKKWEDNADAQLPIILMVFTSTLMQKLLVGYVHRSIIRSELALANLTFMATTIDKLKAAKDSKEPIWQRITSNGVEEEQEVLVR